MEGILDTLARNPQIIAAAFFFIVAGAVIRFVSSWLARAGAVLVVLVLLGVVSSETAKGWALGTLEAGADFFVEAFDQVVLDEEPGLAEGGEDGTGGSDAPSTGDQDTGS
jgi:hypothetical protein